MRYGERNNEAANYAGDADSASSGNTGSFTRASVAPSGCAGQDSSGQKRKPKGTYTTAGREEVRAPLADFKPFALISRQGR